MDDNDNRKLIHLTAISLHARACIHPHADTLPLSLIRTLAKSNSCKHSHTIIPLLTITLMHTHSPYTLCGHMFRIHNDGIHEFPCSHGNSLKHITKAGVEVTAVRGE